MKVTSFPTPLLQSNQANLLKVGQIFSPNALPKDISVSPVQNIKPLRFGMIHPYCGVCPICVAGAAAQKELEAVRKLREDNGKNDLDITVGQAMENIRSHGKETGAAVESSFIGNEDGTRSQVLGLKDLDAFNVAALPRIYQPDGKTYTINVDPMKLGKGTENGLFKKLTRGAEHQEKTNSYDASEGAAPPPIRPELLEGLDKNVRSHGLYHHISEGLEVRTTSMSQPLMVGYTSVAKLRPKELLAASIRALPGFEKGGVEPGGLMNVLGMAAKNKTYDTVYVLVEPWQKELKDYIGTLKQQYGYDVKTLTPQETPTEYMAFKQELDLPDGAEFVRISIKPLRNSLADIDTNLPEGERDTELLQSIALPDPGKEEFLKKAVQETSRTYTKALDLNTIHLDSGLPSVPDLITPKRLDFKG